MAYIFNNEIGLKDSGNLDAFGRLRISEVYTLFDSKLTTNASDFFIYDDEYSGGSGIYLSGDSAYRLSVNAGSGNYAIRQTKMYFNYQPGKSQQILLTGVMSGQTGVIKRVGGFSSNFVAPYNPHNGIFFENSGGTLAVCLVKNGVIERVTQNNWNIDKLNGLGGTDNPSGVLLNPNFVNIYLFDYEWLGVGRVRMGVNIDGISYYCHEFLNANRGKTSVYMRSPNLPIRYEIRSLGSAGTLDQICATVGTETGVQPTGILRAFDSGITPRVVNAAGVHPLIAIRQKTNARDLTIIPTEISVACDSAVSFRFALYIMSGDVQAVHSGITGVATSWNNLSFNVTSLSCDVEAKNNFTTAQILNVTGETILISSGYVTVPTGGGGGRGSVNIEARSAIHLGAKLNGTRDVLVLAVERITSASGNFFGEITIRELDGC